MKFNFKDIMSPLTYEDCRVMIVTGPHNIFNNIVIDELRQRCRSNQNLKMDMGLLADFGFGVDSIGEIEVSNTVDFDTFRNVVSMPNINGKWFANVDYMMLKDKQKKWLDEYIKNPSPNGILSVFITEYKEYRKLLMDKTLQGSKYSSIIQMSFPNREALKYVTRKLFEARHARIEEPAIDLFIVRMSDSYDDYEQVIDKICINSLPDGYMQKEIGEIPAITYDQAFDSLRGIENFVLDDFLERITQPLSSDKLSGRSQVYKMMGYLIEEYGADNLVKKLLYKINQVIQMRLAINNGYIPILVHFSIDEAKELLGEESDIAKLSDYQFRKLAILASKTSLKDWVYMKMILTNIKYKWTKTSYEKALFSLVVRSTLTESRLNNDIGVDNILLNEETPRM